MTTKNLLAIDLGAESGRAVLGRFDGNRLDLEVLHRFSNGPIRVFETLYWDVLGLWREIKTGIGKAARTAGPPATLGIDAWGVDFGLVDASGALVGNPVHYRDSRTDGMLEAAFEVVSKSEIYERTGVQFIKINSLYQVLSIVKGRSGNGFAGVEKLLFMPDLLNFFLTGRAVAEYTIASTSQMLDARSKEWASAMLEKMQIPTSILPELVATGTELGALLPSVVSETGAGDTRVVATAGHDTASAVAAVPASGESWCYISSGTWSLMGAELCEPVITKKTLDHNFTNEGGVAGTIRFLKNIMGLWLVQQCRQSFRRSDKNYDYRALTQMAQIAPAFGSIVDPDDEVFINPDDMPSAIQKYCSDTGQQPPTGKGEILRCCLESLALRYREVVEQLESNTGRRIETIHIVGGGSQNSLLCQMTSDCCQREVLTEPIEATAMGNCLVQLIASGELASLAQARQVIRNSVETKHFEPNPDPTWDQQYERFTSLSRIFD